MTRGQKRWLIGACIIPVVCVIIGGLFSLNSAYIGKPSPTSKEAVEFSITTSNGDIYTSGATAHIDKGEKITVKWHVTGATRQLYLIQDSPGSLNFFPNFEVGPEGTRHILVNEAQTIYLSEEQKGNNIQLAVINIELGAL